MRRKPAITPEAVANRIIGQSSQHASGIIDLSGLKLESVPSALRHVEHVHGLVLSRNLLQELPDWIGELREVQTLTLFDNQLQRVPDTLENLQELSHLNLGGNRLTALPGCLRHLPQMWRLDVSNNNLTSIPDWIAEMRRLWRLDLSGNDIATLPESLRRATSLTELYLHKNPRLGIPEEILGPTRPLVARAKAKPTDPEAILNYYFESIQSRPLNEAKLILVGRGGAGKTSLARRLIDNEFNPAQAKTDGIQIRDWPLQLREKEEIRLHVWDFGGQEIMHATHQFFLTKRSLYIVVLTGREGSEDADAEYWLRLIDSFSDNSPVIVVMNKMDEHAFDLNRRALQQKFPAIRDFVQTDCNSARGIDRLRDAIERETDRLDQLRAKFPKRWFSIKNELASMERNYLDFEEYRARCKELGEDNAEKQDQLAEHLHALGIALNFKDDPRLQDTHVLNPHWVTNGIYKILNAPALAQAQGVIATKDLRTILDHEHYPSRMHAFLLDLLRKFDLCFPLGDDAIGKYLVPELLGKEEPEDTAIFEPRQCLNFEYHYPVLPEGLLPRFIVRTYAMSTNLPRWRFGVILEFEGNRALVKCDGQERKVIIRIVGPEAGRARRRNLLAIIRSHFEHIHADIAKLNPTEMVPLEGHPSQSIAYNDLLTYEQHGERNLKLAMDGKLTEVDVLKLLNGVDIEGVRSATDGPDLQPALRLYISHAEKDEPLRAELDSHLTLLQRRGLIQKWDVGTVPAGEQHAGRRDENLEHADIVLLLISADYIASELCWHSEMSRAMERHAANTARVIPVFVRPVDTTGAMFCELQGLPKDAKPVTTWTNKDEAWADVAKGIRTVVQDLLQRRQNR